MQCNNPISAEFRSKLQQELTTTCQTCSMPDTLTEILTRAIDDWLHERPILQGAATPDCTHEVIAAQTRIGWSGVFKGLLSKKWKKFLEYEYEKQEQPHSFTASRTLALLLNTIWSSSLQLWSNHLDNIHQPDIAGPSPDKLQDMKVQIRTLHAMKPLVLAAHRDQYFHHDLETYLETATFNQMKTYILNYSPAIHTSIRTAQTLVGPSILTFPGFHRSRRLDPQTRNQTLHGQREEPIHHKHSRWKSSAAPKFRAFFTPHPQPQTNPFPLSPTGNPE